MKSLSLSLLLSLIFLYATPQPNIILIMCDDLGWGDVGFNGNTMIKTPHLDQLAKEGIILNRFYSAGPVCSPTRASVITGRHPFRMGIYTANAGHMKSEEITLPELLAAQGYASGHYGKWHLGTLTAMIHDANRGRPRNYSHYSLPTQHGYEAYFCTESKVPTWDPMIKPSEFDTASGESLRYGWAAMEDTDDNRIPQTYGTYYWNGREEMELSNVEGDNSRIIMDRVIPFIQTAIAHQRPFFTTVWFHTPHLPVVTSKYYRELYKDLSHEKQLYYGSITAMDEQVGRLVAFLKANGQFDNTMIWFCSDNGPERQTPGSAGPYRERKRSLYEGGVRVPAFVVWPDQWEGGQKASFPAVTSDYLPTIADYLSLKYPVKDRPLDGIGLRPLLEGKQSQRNSAIGFQHRDRMSWVDDRYKLISTDKGKTYELYDLIADPGEKENIVSQQKAQAGVMKKKLAEWISSCEKSDGGADY